MKSIINLPIPSASKLQVAQGDRVNAKTVIVKREPDYETVTIHLAKLLGIPNQKISGCFTKKTGDQISPGEIIAEKKGIFSKSIVRSPIRGKVGELDLGRGTVNLLKYSDNKEEIIIPVTGIVTDIGKSAVQIEIENTVFGAEKGEGKDTIGQLRLLGSEDAGILSAHSDVSGEIVLCYDAHEVALLKFQVIGVLGIIMVKIPKEFYLPWLQVDENTFKKLTELQDKKIWLRPREKQIICL